MKKIKMIAGTFGFWDGKKVVPKTNKDKAFSVSDEVAERLIRLNMAETVAGEAEAAEIDKDVLEVTDEGKAVRGGEKPENEGDEYDEDSSERIDESADEEIDETVIDKTMTAKELRELGKIYGLTFKVGMSKAEMVDALKDHFAAENAEDDEDAPELDASKAVQ